MLHLLFQLLLQLGLLSSPANNQPHPSQSEHRRGPGRPVTTEISTDTYTDTTNPVTTEGEVGIGSSGWDDKN